ncbi:MAG: asparagine synthetase B, partial [Vicinamibacterales bacterium]
MCGIAGFADLAPGPHSLDVDRSRVRAMCDVMRHRGPDDDGYYVAPGVALGMRRLSIIDLATGRQPIHNEDATVWVVFNGEIYNYRELRRELERAGHRFSTSGDTETIVHGYEEWGSQVFSRLRGMFGVAIWDAPARTLLVG